MTDKVFSFKEQAILEQARRHYIATKDAFDTLERKAQTVISVSSVVITIITGFRLINPQAGQYPPLVLVIALYVLTLICCLIVLVPRDRTGEPIGAKWETMSEMLAEEDNVFYQRLLRGYDDAVADNAKLNNVKSRWVIAAFVLMGAMVVATLIMALASI